MVRTRSNDKQIGVVLPRLVRFPCRINRTRKARLPQHGTARSALPKKEVLLCQALTADPAAAEVLYDSDEGTHGLLAAVPMAMSC